MQGSWKWLEGSVFKRCKTGPMGKDERNRSDSLGEDGGGGAVV